MGSEIMLNIAGELLPASWKDSFITGTFIDIAGGK